MTQNRNTATNFLHEFMQLNLPQNVKGIWIGFEIIVWHFGFNLAFGAHNDSVILFIECAERTEARNAERVKAVEGLRVGVDLPAYVTCDLLLCACHASCVGFVVSSPRLRHSWNVCECGSACGVGVDDLANDIESQ